LPFRLRRFYTTNWRAVGGGFLIAVVLGLVAPGVGHVAGGFIAGLVAGYMTGGVLSGVRHGLLAGATGGVVLGVVLVVSAAFGPVGGLLG
jgi:hypothetical protein